MSKLTIEFKTPWALGDISNLIDCYKKECKQLAAGRIKHKGKITRAVEQVFVHMTINRHRYGVLTTLNQTWFLRKFEDNMSPDSSHLQISPVVLSVASSPSLSLTKAWMALLLSIERNADWLYSSPHSSTVVSPAKPRALPKYRQNYQSVKLDGLMHWQNIIGRSQAGVVACGKFRDFEGVVFKTIDVSKRKDGMAQFQKEVEIYQHLQELQGDVIPKFIAFGNLGGLLQVIVLEYVGRKLSSEEFVSRRQDVEEVLNLVHSKGVQHGDLRLPNIMIDDDSNKIRLIDFGMSSIISDGEICDVFEIDEENVESE
ncbi:UNVERIFIED_CONTAM: hypothetical protein HDU68_005103 [Siphonaria sp. JEL0065]|nr:hypothetical protein HDU68_005103 [Siphonaria sp. JEL0065]